MSNKHFKVTMREVQHDGQVRTIVQNAFVSSREEVIRIYGLNELDIVSYQIDEL